MHPGAAAAWRWLVEAQVMLVDVLVWLGIVAAFGVGGLALLAVCSRLD